MIFSFEKGDYVLHLKYGISKFVDLQYMEIEGSGYDFFKLEYLDSSFVFIPNYQIHLLKFHSDKTCNTQIETLKKSKEAKVR